MKAVIRDRGSRRKKNTHSNSHKICRLCLNEKRMLMEIFDSSADNNNLTIDQKIMACATIDLSSGDGLPTRICIKCLSSVNAAFEFRVQCENADKTLHNIHNLLIASESEDKKEKLDLTQDREEKENVEKLEIVEDPSHIIVIKKQEKETRNQKPGDLLYIINEKDPKEEIFEDEMIYCNQEELPSSTSTETFSFPAEENSVDELPNNLFSTQDNTQESYKIVIKPSENREGIGVTEKKRTGGEAGKSPCPFCNKMLTRVEEHIRLLHRNRVYICTKHDCGAEFLTLKNLQSHQLTCFQMEKAYKCARCNKEFHRKSNYKAHVRRHDDKKEFQCQLCDKAFVDSTGLRRHFLKHHEPEQEIFVSGCCGKRFKSKEGLKKHIQNEICGVHIFQVGKEEDMKVMLQEAMSEEEVEESLYSKT